MPNPFDNPWFVSRDPNEQERLQATAQPDNFVAMPPGVPVAPKKGTAGGFTAWDLVSRPVGVISDIIDAERKSSERSKRLEDKIRNADRK